MAQQDRTKAPTLLCVAHDTTPSKALRMLISHAAESGFSTDFILLDGGSILGPSLFGLEEKVKNADVVVIGMSSEQNAGVEIDAARFCLTHRKRFGFFADAHGAYRRDHFAEFRLKANFVLVVSEDEMIAATTTFPAAQVTATGNPQWATYFEPKDRDQARALVHANERQYVVFAPGTKDPDHNITVWKATIRAAGLHWENRLVVLSRHPGDKAEQERYAHLTTIAEAHHVQLYWYDGTGDDLLPGVDLVINGTSLRVHALAQLIPVIDYFEDSSQDWLKKDTGSWFGYFYDSGAVLDIYNETWVELATAMLIIADNPTILRSHQSTAVRRMSAQESLAAMLGAVFAHEHSARVA
jgi:hypothetical protein